MKIELPLGVRYGNSNFRFSMNTYRNSNHFVLSKVKKKFETRIAPDVSRLPTMSEIELTYTIYFKTKARRDISNFCSILDKFFCDSLVKNKKIPDDSFDYIKKVTYIFGGIDKNERCEVLISEVNSQ